MNEKEKLDRAQYLFELPDDDDDFSDDDWDYEDYDIFEEDY